MSFIVKNTTFPGLLDLVAPLNCKGCGRLGTPLCDRCKNYIKSARTDLCPNCKNRTHQNRGPKNAKSPSFLKYRKLEIPTDECPHCHLPLAYVVGERNGLLDDLIQDYKYNSVRAIGRELADLLNSALPKKLPKNTIIVPLPTSHRHIRARGLDHTAKLARYVAKSRGLKVQKLLLRAKDTTQVGASSKLRIKQANEAYALNPKYEIDPNATYLLLDDVWTTGSSMKASIELLRRSGAKHIRLALLAVNHLTS